MYKLINILKTLDKKTIKIKTTLASTIIEKIIRKLKSIICTFTFAKERITKQICANCTSKEKYNKYIFFEVVP